jgi:DUF971 family protein
MAILRVHAVGIAHQTGARVRLMRQEFADRIQLCPRLRSAARLIFQDTHDFTLFKYHFVKRLN